MKLDTKEPLDLKYHSVGNWRGPSAHTTQSGSTMSAAVETINLPHLPSNLFVHAALYRNIQNAAFLRQQLLAGNADFEYAFIDASMVG